MIAKLLAKRLGVPKEIAFGIESIVLIIFFVLISYVIYNLVI
jgi:hypothetical protein